MKKKIPIGISDFKKIRDGNYYYVDKTSFIEEILEKKTDVTLLTRPRRFGKTLNLSSLKYFLDIDNSEENKKLFLGLNIEKTQWMEEQGKYPVIFLTMKSLGGKNYSEFLLKFKTLVSKLFNSYELLRGNLNERDRIIFDNFWFSKENIDYSDSLSFLSELLYKHYKIRPVLLIDEYDSPMIKANEKGYYEDVKELIGNFYGNALKDSLCSFSVVTGILRVAKESIFSTLNNLKVSTILTGDYNHFGMTETEVEDILQYYLLETTLLDTQIWYNGYLFGDEKVYNPWSILNHCDTKKLETYWINTSANTLIKEILKSADKEINDVFHTLLKGESVRTILQENMIFGEKYSDNTLLYLMFSAGYLTIEKKGEKRKEYYLKIPNYEVKEYFKETFIDIASSDSANSFNDLETALYNGNILIKAGKVDSVEEIIQNMLVKSMSYLDSSNQEKNYHNLILGMLIGLDAKFFTFSNRESGLGRYDLALEPKNKGRRGYVFEFKVAKKEKDMNKLGEEALKQINTKLYCNEFKSRGVNDIQKIGMVFYKKIVKFYMN